MASDHIERVSQHELNQQKKLKERRETFEEAFKEDLEEYKTTGSIPSMRCTSILLNIYVYMNAINRFISFKLRVTSVFTRAIFGRDSVGHRFKNIR